MSTKQVDQSIPFKAFDGCGSNLQMTAPLFIDKTLVVGPFQCNCRILACPKTGEAAVIDPGDDADQIVRTLASLKTADGAPIKVKYLFHTHAHLDHIGATRGVRENLSAGAGNSAAPSAGASAAGVTHPLIAVHRDDEVLYKQLKMQGGLFGMKYDDPLPIDHYFEHEQKLQVGTLRFSVVHSPGHSPGSVCLRLHEDSAAGVPETLFSGDTLFQGSVGRTDLWGGDQDLMFKNIRTRIFTLDDDTRVCPGHGPETAVGIEKRENPFFR